MYVAGHARRGMVRHGNASQARQDRAWQDMARFGDSMQAGQGVSWFGWAMQARRGAARPAFVRQCKHDVRESINTRDGGERPSFISQHF